MAHPVNSYDSELRVCLDLVVVECGRSRQLPSECRSLVQLPIIARCS
jgi:hypothetical protein